MLPNFIIAGVNKAGTTSLFSYLAEHPGVCPSSVKETCYFLPIRYGEEMQDVTVYEDLFFHCKNQKIIMEATPGYFYGGDDLAVEMRQVLGDVSILIILREPVERLISFFRFMKSSLMIPKDMSLETYVGECHKRLPDMLKKRGNNPYFGIEGGCYSRYLAGWQKVFGHRLKVVFFDELREDPKNLLKAIARFLQIDDSCFDAVAFGIRNKTLGYKNRYFHSWALQLNRDMETVFRKAPHFKRMVRNIYYRLNGGIAGDDIDYKTVSSLKLYYERHNRHLRLLLEGADDVHLPVWLTEVKGTASDTSKP